MKKSGIVTLDDIALCVKEHLLPEIHEAVEVCIESYRTDELFNDMWTFGTQFWRNTWNRFESIASLDDNPFEKEGKGNEYKLKAGPFVIHHHRINADTHLPNGGKAVKESANRIQLSLFDKEYNVPDTLDNIVLAIDADIKHGLREVFVGEIMASAPGSSKYEWAKKAPVFLAKGVEASSAEFVEIPTLTNSAPKVPAEEIPAVVLELDRFKDVKKK